MTGLMDKIRAVLSRRAAQPSDTSETYGTSAPEGGAALPGEPTLGSALGIRVDGPPGGGAAGPGSDTGAADELGGR